MGSSATKAKQGEHEKALVENANTIANRNKELYRPLEAGFIKEAGRDVSGVLGGRANADTAQAFSAGQGANLGASSSSGGFGSGRTLMGQAKQGVIQNDALGGGLAAANLTAQGVKDKAQLGAVNVGQGGRAYAMQGLSTAARAQNQEIMAKAQASSSMQNTNMGFGSDLGAGLYKKFNPTDTSAIDGLLKQLEDMKNPSSTFTMGP